MIRSRLAYIFEEGDVNGRLEIKESHEGRICACWISSNRQRHYDQFVADENGDLDKYTINYLSEVSGVDKVFLSKHVKKLWHLSKFLRE